MPEWDVAVVGGGPAGIGAALGSARTGASTILIEAQGCLGGVWTSGLLSLILDAENKTGVIAELCDRLNDDGALRQGALYDAEAMKWHLEEMMREAGVQISLHSRCASARVESGSLLSVETLSCSGSATVEANMFIDATGNGDLGALAGCGFDVGRPGDGLTQPMTLLATVSGVPELPPSERDFVVIDKGEFLDLLRSVGIEPSYQKPSLFRLPGGLHCLMINHEYGGSALDEGAVSAATIRARREINLAVRALRKLPGWQNLHLVSTPAHIGVREGRRLHGLYTVCSEDLQRGARFPDAICRVTFCADVHSVTQDEGGGYTSPVHVLPYDIPLRSLVASDLSNLLMCGRCISGDFIAHASYRVTGNATTTGEAAGHFAARLALENAADARAVADSQTVEPILTA
jgi:hypothetical protein